MAVDRVVAGDGVPEDGEALRPAPGLLVEAAAVGRAAGGHRVGQRLRPREEPADDRVLQAGEREVLERVRVGGGFAAPGAGERDQPAVALDRYEDPAPAGRVTRVGLHVHHRVAQRRRGVGGRVDPAGVGDARVDHPLLDRRVTQGPQPGVRLGAAPAGVDHQVGVKRVTRVHADAGHPVAVAGQARHPGAVAQGDPAPGEDVGADHRVQ